jgi:Sec-independent protein translocase protein TatA
MTTMNATSIATYISKLETENMQLAAKVDKLAKDGLAIRLKLLEYEREFEIDDEESVCSNNLGLSYDSDETDDTYVIDESDDEVSSVDSTDSDSMEEHDECYNPELVRALGALSYHEKDVHKSNAYAKAADAIYELKFKVDDGHELAIGDKKVPGIGKSIARLIDEFLETGKLKKLEQLAAVDETHDDYADTNEEVAYYLETLAQEETDAFKGKAYVKASNAIRELDFEVTHGDELADGPKKVPGIGKGIARKIDQFLQSC